MSKPEFKPIMVKVSELHEYPPEQYPGLGSEIDLYNNNENKKSTRRSIIPMAVRFWSKVQILTPEECWIWVGGRHRQNYGTFGIRDTNGAVRIEMAHRVAWQLHNGPIPAKGVIRHKCDNPPCCNYDHLILGTTIENMRDMVTRNRHGTAKLTVEQVLEIRELYRLGDSQTILAKKFNISHAQMNRIVRRLRWDNV